ncbi:hypothetical protein BVX95_00480 [archaeon D22]|nr:hypothetical protein BVX95_00480 [archaeon D22]
MEPLTLLFVIIVGLVAGFMAALGGGSGMLITSLLMIIGYPANMAVATNKIGTLGMRLTAIPKFYKHKAIDVKLGLKTIPLAIIGNFIGASILVEIDREVFEKIISVVLILLIPLILNKSGLKDIKVSNRSKVLGSITLFLSYIWTGLIGMGGGLIRHPIFTNFFGLDAKKAISTPKIAGMFGGLVSISVFTYHGLIDYKIGVLIALCMGVGGYFAAQTAIEKGNKFVKNFIAAAVVITVGKILFF